MEKVRSPGQLLLEGADEALGTAVALGTADERRAGRGPQEAQLVLEGVGSGLAAVVVADGQPCRHAPAVGTEAGLDALANRLKGLEARARLGDVDANARGAMVDGDEDDGLALQRRHGLVPVALA